MNVAKGLFSGVCLSVDAFVHTYEAEILTRSSASIMMYFPFEFMFLGADCNIENGLSADIMG